MNQIDIFDNPKIGYLDYQEKTSSEWKWSFSDYPKEKNGLKVFSCFSCGGGSTMGYKLAGCDVIGNVEIDKKMNDIYVKNHNPKFNFLMDIRNFNNLPDNELPCELFNLDILDGSPPCTTFSMAGEREKNWGKKKKFREGQKEQTLDDLSFIFIDTIAKLKPKIAIMENVEGLLQGNAWGYVQKIYKQINDIGYNCKHWLLKGEKMGVPQTRHRVFFIIVRNDLRFDLEKLDLSFNYAPITYGEVKSEKGEIFNGKKETELLANCRYGEKDLSPAHRRLYGKNSWFNNVVIYDNEVCPTVRSKPDMYRFGTNEKISLQDLTSISTFPQDYDFGMAKANVGYICGMSVPPLMIKRIVARLIEKNIFEVENE